MFRREIRDWLAANLTDECAARRPRPGDRDFAQRLAFARRLAAAGWTTLAWPVAHGGRGASHTQQVIFHEEYAKAAAPSRIDHIGTTMVGPTLIDHGTPEQQGRFLPALAAVDELWCQGYSEPGAGSDLAGVTTRARLDGDSFLTPGSASGSVTYRATRTLWVEPETGAIVGYREQQHRELVPTVGSPVVIFDGDLGYDQATLDAVHDEAAGGRSRLKLLGTYLPLALAVLGLLLAVLGYLIAGRTRPARDRRPAPAAEVETTRAQA